MASALSLMNPQPESADAMAAAGGKASDAPATRISAVDVAGQVEQLADVLAATALERDRAGGHAAAERQAIRDSGLLNLSIPACHGGAGASWASVQHAVRRLARVDSALAHVFAFHHLQIATICLFATPEASARLLSASARDQRFWGNALNPRDRRALAIPQADGSYNVHGDKSFCSGARGSDWLTLSAWHEDSQSLLIGVTPTTRNGIEVHHDWDAIGQRQTDSGTVSFRDVELPADAVLVRPGQAWSPAMHLRSCLAQLVLVNLYTGIAEGALDAARDFTREQARPWPASGVQASVDDPFTGHRYGRLVVGLRAAQLLADRAAALADEALVRGVELRAEERGEVAIAVAEARVAAHDISLAASSGLFDVAGARAASRTYGFDRFWRNARTHTLHDPIDYKLRDLGRWFVDGRYPEPTAYS